MKLKALSGKTRKLTSIIEPSQQKFVNWALPLIPSSIQTYHLTLMTIPLSLAIILLAKMTNSNLIFFTGHAAVVFLQYVSDILDGALGRYRQTGLIRWGFYMDHLLDYFFAASAILGFAIFFKINVELTAVLIAVLGAFFAHEFIIGNIRGIVNTSGYYGVGPTEMRFGAILLDLILAVTNYKPHESVFNVLTFLLVVMFTFIAWITQNSLWRQDMKAKKSL